MKSMVERIAEERATHEARGYTAEHDINHTDGSLATAALCYLETAQIQLANGMTTVPDCYHHKKWPWKREEFKPRDPITNLVKAGALLAAAGDRAILISGN